VPVVDAVATTGLAGFIVIVNVPSPEPLIFFAVSVTVNTPAVIGVPLITPVAVFKLNPAGNVVEP